jgi:hypothetical protein
MEFLAKIILLVFAFLLILIPLGLIFAVRDYYRRKRKCKILALQRKYEGHLQNLFDTFHERNRDAVKDIYKYLQHLTGVENFPLYADDKIFDDLDLDEGDVLDGCLSIIEKHFGKDRLRLKESQFNKPLPAPVTVRSVIEWVVT